MKKSRALLFLAEFGTPLFVVVLWWVVTAQVLPASGSPRALFFPDPIKIAQTFAAEFVGPGFWEVVVPTLVRFIVGFFWASVLGVALGLFLGVNRAARLAALPFITFFRALPGVALIPILTIFLGLGDAQKIVLVIVVCTWPIMINAMDGVAAIDETVLESASAYRIRGLERYRLVILPAALPQIFAGLRIALSVALIVTVVAELIGANSGIGFYLVHAKGSFAMPELWAGLLLLGVVGCTLNMVFSLAEGRVLGWHKGARENALS